jgi:valyl-tRNA synthetase
LDETRSKAVTEAYIRMFNKGLIYRATRLVNWSCALRTALSDLEVEYIELSGPTKL